MGKSNNRVKNNIFKVAGSKSLKAKNKAKAVTAERLKQLNFKNKQKINNIDEQLVNLNTEVRQAPKESETRCNRSEHSNDRVITERQDKIRKFNEAEENCQEALKKLYSMEM